MTPLFTASRETLLSAMAGPRSAIERRTTIAILTNLHMQIEGDMLTVTGTDLDLAMTSRRKVATGGSGSAQAFTVPAHLLHGFISSLPKAAEVAFAMDEQSVVLSAAKRKARLMTLPASDFPVMADEAAQTVMTVPAGSLSAALKRCIPCASTEETRYYLCGVYCHEAEGRFVMVSTSGHMLARIDTGAAAPAMEGAIIPNKTSGIIADTVAGMASGDMVNLEFTSRKVSMTVAGENGEEDRISSKLIDGTFPDYTRVIPPIDAAVCAWQVDAEEIAQAIRAISSISSERGRGMKMEWGGGEWKAIVTNPDSGEASAYGEAAQSEGVEDAVLQIGMNSRYMMELAGLAGETMELRFSDANAPIRISSREDEVFVLMPMRV